LRAKILQMGEESIARAAMEVRRGGLVVYPTDTVYGLGCDPFNQAAVRRLFEAKGRDSKPIPVLCASTEKAQGMVELNGRALELAHRFWPGALTIVAPLRRYVPSQLSQGKPFLGVRVPNHSGCLGLIAACGGWLTGTSANVSGRPSSRSAADALDQIGNAVDLILDGGRLAGTESTVVQVDGNEVTILRTGLIGVGNELKDRRTS